MGDISSLEPGSADFVGNMSSGTNILARASVPAFLCPPGTKVHILNLGTMRVDAGWYVHHDYSR